MKAEIEASSRPYFFSADDLGMGEDKTEGILRAADLGLIQSTSLCVTGLQTDDEIRSALHRLSASVSVGLHLSFTEGRPLGDPKPLQAILSQDGNFKSGIQTLENEHFIGAKAFEAEILKQVGRFRELTGAAPNHLDSHQYFLYLSPNGFSGLLRAAEKLRIPIRSPKPFTDVQRLARFKDRLYKRYGLELPFSVAERAERLEAIFSCHSVCVRSDDLCIEYDSEVGQRFDADLKSAGRTTEIVCHPVLITDQGRLSLKL